MKKFILSTITAVVLSTSVFAANTQTIPAESSINKISDVNKVKLEELRQKVLATGATFKTTTSNGEFKSLRITNNSITVVINDDSSVLLITQGQEVKTSLNKVIELFMETVEKQTQA